jgi:hypothetical protein
MQGPAMMADAARTCGLRLPNLTRQCQQRFSARGRVHLDVVANDDKIGRTAVASPGEKNLQLGFGLGHEPAQLAIQLVATKVCPTQSV